MPRMTGGQALVRSLSREGVRVIFGLPGAQQYHALDALYDQSEIRYITTRHEQAASYMADGYARVTGDVGTAMVVPGPGLFNASAGIATAYAASSPVLVITGENHRGRAGKGRQGPDATSDELDWIRPMTKWAARALKPADVPALVHEAFLRLRTGRPRPVEIEIPPAVLAAEADVELMEPVGVERPGGSPERIQQGASLLAGAKRPAIWAGGGVIISEATPALQRLAEHLQAPVVTTPNGKGALSDRHPLSLGLVELRHVPLRQWLTARDVILVVGTRSDVAGQFKEQQIVQVNIDAEEIGDAPNAVGIVGDARGSLEDLAHLITAMAPARPDCADEVRALNAARFDPAIQLEPQHSLMNAIRAAMPDDGILVPCMNQMGYYSRNYYPVYAPRTYLTASYYGTLGFAFP
ncbi:MAG: thiamine pyrophosphate-binding protein, partial [Candidatus Latescibacteria bacterium]|nr:thiamine pyrophosphate-binding protein [Candidatus Latescibacterota bacterium]